MTTLAAVAMLGAGMAPAPSGAVGTRGSGSARIRRAAPAPDFEAASREEAEAVAQLNVARARRAELERLAQQLDGDVERVNDRARSTAADLERVDRAKRSLEQRVRESRLVLLAARQRTGRTAAELYRQAGASAPPALAALGGSQSIHDASSAQQYLEGVGARVAADLDAVRIANLDILDARRALKLRRRTVVRAAHDAAVEAAKLRAVQDQQRRAVAAAQAEEAHEVAVLAAAQARKAEFERAAAANQAASGTITDVLHARPISGGAPGRFRFPADGPITSPFGPRRHPIFHTVRMHTGIDIGAGFGTAVRAGGPGVVVLAGPASGYGNAIVVDHGGGIATLYGHVSRFGVRVGQKVTAGETIGAVGNTGNSTGPHLHFEVRVRGVPVDPMPYL